MAHKCFCHLGGYKVKDADARAWINYLINRVETIEKILNITPEPEPDVPVDPDPDDPVDPDPDDPVDPDPDDPSDPDDPETETCSVVTDAGDYGNTLIFAKGMTWGEWFTSEYYDPDFSVAMNGYVMLTGSGYLVDHTGDYVSSTDAMISGLNYEVRGVDPDEPVDPDPEAKTYNISYYKRNEYCKNGESDFTMQELITTHEYEEGSPITPLTLPNEEGFTASDWEIK